MSEGRTVRNLYRMLLGVIPRLRSGNFGAKFGKRQHCGASLRLTSRSIATVSKRSTVVRWNEERGDGLRTSRLSHFGRQTRIVLRQSRHQARAKDSAANESSIFITIRRLAFSEDSSSMSTGAAVTNLAAISPDATRAGFVRAARSDCIENQRREFARFRGGSSWATRNINGSDALLIEWDVGWARSEKWDTSRNSLFSPRRRPFRGRTVHSRGVGEIVRDQRLGRLVAAASRVSVAAPASL